jgi:hypothetical protein
MKRMFFWGLAMGMTTVSSAGKMDALAAGAQTVVVTAAADSGDAEATAGAGDSDSDDQKVLIQSIDTDEPAGKKKREVAWLGVATEETSEALASQLGLSAGEGLTVTYVAPESPAAKAGLQKNDVLAEFEEQLLVHPAQFRKLIQMHKEGDSVKLTVYRAGKKKSITATIGKTKRNLGFFYDEHSFPSDVHVIARDLTDSSVGENIREQMKALRESLGKAGLDKENLNQEIKRSMEEVRKSIQEAMRQATNAARTFGPAAREFQELARRGMDVDKDATVIVKSKHNTVKSIVKTDESGTYVVVASPKKHLTAHDKSGKLLFHGEIETKEEQARVPKNVWDRVKPMVDQLKEDKTGQPEAEEEEQGI